MENKLTIYWILPNFLTVVNEPVDIIPWETFHLEICLVSWSYIMFYMISSLLP